MTIVVQFMAHAHIYNSFLASGFLCRPLITIATTLDPDQDRPLDTWIFKGVSLTVVIQGSHRLERYLNIQDCLEKSLKVKYALKST